MEYKGYDIPEDIRYHNEHCWVRKEADILFVGWTDFAQKLAQELSGIVLPEEGDAIVKDKFMGTIESGKWVGKLISPVNGVIIELNEDVMDDPRLVNKEPFGKGWIMKVRASEPEQVDGLLDAGAYKAIIDVKLKEIGME